MGSFNVLHPGSKKSRFKDMEIVAKIMDKWDIVAVQELLPLVSIDYKNNRRVFEAGAE